MEWKKRAIELYLAQIKKDIKTIQQQLSAEYNLELKYNYVKGTIMKYRQKMNKGATVDDTTDKVEKAGEEEVKVKPKFIMPDIHNNILHNKWENNKIIKFGIVSDTHLCSKYQQLDFLNEVYNRFESEGITEAYHSGDITEGCKMRAGHEYEIFKHGSDEQVNYVIEVYPKRKNITTYFILGNHDLSHMKNGGVDIGKAIIKGRPDMKYLGALNAKVFLTPNTIMELNHPLDGASYALSYAIQKMADSYSGDAKPNILINGHHHKLFYCLYRNIHCIEAGTFEAQTPWMRGKRIAAHIGGIIITIEVDEEGTIKRFIPEFITYYNEKKNNY